jgi:hypothetical protein
LVASERREKEGMTMTVYATWRLVAVALRSLSKDAPDG